MALPAGWSGRLLRGEAGQCVARLVPQTSPLHGRGAGGGRSRLAERFIEALLGGLGARESAQIPRDKGVSGVEALVLLLLFLLFGESLVDTSLLRALST